MAIRIIEGVPGSGKSYYAVKHVADTYFEKQSDGRYELVKDVEIITNIDSFQPDHLDLKILVKDAGGIKQFFAESHQKELTDKIGKPIVYIIDEAQKYFRKGARDLDEVYSYFEYHRHFGHDVYLITQNSKKLPPDIALLCEYVIVAAPRTRSVLGEFKYKWLSDGELLQREAFKPDSGVFALYKSMDTKESEKIKNPIMRSAGLAIGAALIVICGGIYYFKVVWLGTAPPALPSDSSTVVSSSAGTTIPSSPGLPSSGASSVKSMLSSTVISIDGQDHVYIIHKGRFIAVEKFPWPIEKNMGSWWADLPPSEVEPKSAPPAPDRRNDSASGSAHAPEQAGARSAPAEPLG